MRGIGGHGFLLRLGGGRPRFRRVVRPVEVHEHRHRAHQEEGIENLFGGLLRNRLMQFGTTEKRRSASCE